MRTQDDRSTRSGGTSQEDVVASARQAHDLIAEAKQVVARRHGLDPDDAFDLLRHYSRAWDRPLRDVARKVVHGSWVADA